MEPAVPTGMPDDVLIVEDDAIIALDFEDTIFGFGVKRVRCAGSVARALRLIADRAPDFALLDVGLASEKSFAVAERLEAMQIPFVFITGYGGEFGLPPSAEGHADAAKALHQRCAGGGAAARAVSGRLGLITPASAQASSTTVPHRRGRAASPSSGRCRRRS